MISVLSQVIADLIHGKFTGRKSSTVPVLFICLGELMQLSSSSDDTQRFQVYLDKTYRKTASLIANSCKAVSKNHSLSLLTPMNGYRKCEFDAVGI